MTSSPIFELIVRLFAALAPALLAASAARWSPWQAWMAGYSTRTGERRRVTLADGTVLLVGFADPATAEKLIVSKKPSLPPMTKCSRKTASWK